MKKQKLILLTSICCLALLSFKGIEIYHSDNKGEKEINDKSLEEKKAILTQYYTDLIRQEIDRRFDESDDGSINEKEMILSIPLLTEYGCAYTGTGCSGNKVCGVTMLYAQTFGYTTWSSESAPHVCEDVPQP